MELSRDIPDPFHVRWWHGQHGPALLGEVGSVGSIGRTDQIT